jgi:hypothetical protein
MRRIGISAGSGQRGYALVLVMVALVTLTILGVTGIQSAQLDMKITQNMRHHKQLQYGALAGQDHARMLTEPDDFDGQAAFMAAEEQAANGGCTLGWISLEAGAVAAPDPQLANGAQLGSYTVDICRGVCGSPLPGNDLNAAEKNYSFSLDVVANGALTGITSTARMGGLLVGSTQGECQ